MAATHKMVNGVRVELTKGEAEAIEADWAANLVASLKQQLLDEAAARLQATDAERVDLAVAAALDPARRPELQRLEDYRAALREMPARIAADLDAAEAKPWPEAPRYEPDWPAKPERQMPAEEA